jgi:hypothetical protein
MRRAVAAAELNKRFTDSGTLGYWIKDKFWPQSYRGPGRQPLVRRHGGEGAGGLSAVSRGAQPCC